MALKASFFGGSMLKFTAEVVDFCGLQKYLRENYPLASIQEDLMVFSSNIFLTKKTLTVLGDCDCIVDKLKFLGEAVRIQGALKIVEVSPEAVDAVKTYLIENKVLNKIFDTCDAKVLKLTDVGSAIFLEVDLKVSKNLFPEFYNALKDMIVDALAASSAVTSYSEIFC
jgi:hypothetical protein